MLSAVVLTKNSEKKIRRCLRSLSFAHEVVVIDDHSKDQTVRIAKKQGARVYTRKLAGDFAAQRNFGLKKSKNHWVLFVDVDEKVSRGLKEEIERELKKDRKEINGYYFKRKDKFLNRWLKYGETARVRLLRLARKNAGNWQGRVHETWQIKEGKGTFKFPLLHLRDLGIREFMERLNNYARIRALELYRQRKKESWLKIFVFPSVKFFYNYFICLGFLDGFRGLVMAWLMSWHSLLVRIWLKLYWLNHGQENFTSSAKTS